MNTTTLLAIGLIVAHYVLPLSAFVIKKLPYDFAIAVSSYILTLIGLYVWVCVSPECTPLRIWLMVSTVLAGIIGVLSAPEHNYESGGPGCLLLFPAFIGMIIWIIVL